MNKPVILLLGALIAIQIQSAVAQDLDSLMDKVSTPQTTYATATFKSTRIINGHSIERMKKKQLEFRISHRFGELHDGPENLWGVDYGVIHFSLEYGITDWLELGIGRSSYEKTFDGFAKLSLLRQSKGEHNMPIHLSYLFSTECISSNADTNVNKNFSSRLSFIQQVMIARKINDMISVQITPTYIHRNIVPTELDKNDLFAVGFGGRIKLSKRIAINGEYYWVNRPNQNSLPVKYYNPLAFGIDIETGGHVFQIMFTNAQAMREGGFIGKTTGSWTDAGVRLGFNISRVFSFQK